MFPIRVILIETSHPGNIGAAARAMKTMGLESLHLVKPRQFPHENAVAMAAGAADILENAVVHPDLATALQDCQLVIGSSARTRHMEVPLITPRESAPIVHQYRQQGPVALLFGREQTGLSNEELLLCHYHIMIPANPVYPVLNIAAAVQIIAYELYAHKHTIPANTAPLLASTQETQYLLEHFEKVLQHIDFMNHKHSKKLMQRIQRLFLKAQLEPEEVAILRGFLHQVEQKCP
ncbi:MAG: RNA methyltransferase [Legionellaceae bacterium]|nr:RNA methyltransferase [Legionellaceae bacterium]